MVMNINHFTKILPIQNNDTRIYIKSKTDENID